MALIVHRPTEISEKGTYSARTNRNELIFCCFGRDFLVVQLHFVVEVVFLDCYFNIQD